MGAKSKKRKGRQAETQANPLKEVERHLARRNFREAVKEARRVHRQQPSEATRRLLETATLARVRELQQHGLREEARALASSLLEMGLTDATVQAELPAVLAGLGMLDRAAAGNGAAVDADPAVLKTAADQAVVRPGEAPRSLPKIREEALLVRAALEAMESGRDDEALEKLQPIGRSSPLSDWRLFVRGLAAYYRGDDEAMRASWDRLEPGRHAARIAAQLRTVAEARRDDAAGLRTAAFLKVEKAVLGEAVLGDLLELERLVAAAKWKETAAVLRRLRSGLNRVDPELWRRVSSFVYRAIVFRADERQLRQLQPYLEPPPLDPHWHRAAALILEREEGIYAADPRWRLYQADLDHVAELPPEQRSLAKAMVYHHLGRAWLWEATSADPDEFGESESLDEEDLAAAIEHLEHAIHAAPDYAPPYTELAEAYRRSDRRRDAAATLEELLQHHADHLEAILALADDYLAADQPFQALPYAERAANLKPLDRDIRGRLWIGHVKAARLYALEEKYDLARAALDTAETGDRPRYELVYAVPARRAILEMKAGEQESAERLIEQAIQLATDPAPVQLLLTIEAIRYRLPKADREAFERQWKSLAKRRCTSQAAGQMSRIMTPFLASDTRYPRRSQHAQQVLEYVRRSSRVKWNEQDLRSACEFLKVARDAEDLDSQTADEVLETKLRKGIREFPDNPYFLVTAGDEEIDKGPYECDRLLAHRYLQQGLELAERSGNPDDASLIDIAKKRLSFLDDVGFHRPSPFHFFGGLDDDDYDDDDDDDDYEDEDEDEDDLDLEAFASSAFGAMPAGLRRMLEDMADRFGLAPEEVIRRMAEADSPERAIESLSRGGDRQESKKKGKTRRK